MFSAVFDVFCCCCRVDSGADEHLGLGIQLQVGDAFWKDPSHPTEDNWVWSPQGEIQMHLPERWVAQPLAQTRTSFSSPKAT